MGRRAVTVVIAEALYAYSSVYTDMLALTTRCRTSLYLHTGLALSMYTDVQLTCKCASFTHEYVLFPRVCDSGTQSCARACSCALVRSDAFACADAQCTSHVAYSVLRGARSRLLDFCPRFHASFALRLPRVATSASANPNTSAALRQALALAISVASMASATLIADLGAVQTFLRTHARTMVGGCSAQVEATQATAFIAKVRSAGYIPVASATELLDMLAGGPWSDECKASMQQAIVESMESPVAPQLSKVKTQNFMHFERYITPSLKQTLQSANVPFRVKLTSAAEVLANLGVRCPSERSVQACVGVVLLLGMGYEETLKLTPHEMLVMAKDFKGLLKMTCNQQASSLGLPSNPRDAAELLTLAPTLHAKVFSEERPCPIDLSPPQLAEVIQRIPLRKSNASLAPSAKSSSSLLESGALGMMHQMQQLQCHTLQLVASLAGGDMAPRLHMFGNHAMPRGDARLQVLRGVGGFPPLVSDGAGVRGAGAPLGVDGGARLQLLGGGASPGVNGAVSLQMLQNRGPPRDDGGDREDMIQDGVGAEAGSQSLLGEVANSFRSGDGAPRLPMVTQGEAENSAEQEGLADTPEEIDTNIDEVNEKKVHHKRRVPSPCVDDMIKTMSNALAARQASKKCKKKPAAASPTRAAASTPVASQPPATSSTDAPRMPSEPQPTHFGGGAIYFDTKNERFRVYARKRDRIDRRFQWGATVESKLAAWQKACWVVMNDRRPSA